MLFLTPDYIYIAQKLSTRMAVDTGRLYTCTHFKKISCRPILKAYSVGLLCRPMTAVALACTIYLWFYYYSADRNSWA